MTNARLNGATALFAALLLATAMFAVVPAQQDQPGAQRSSAPAPANDGERKFEIHCGRCHNPPRTLSPEAVPAVLRHMRVRAMLTEEDEKAILEYLAP